MTIDVVNAQLKKITVGGVVTDTTRAHYVVGASVEIINNENVSVKTITDNKGVFTLAVYQGNYQLKVSFVGYENIIIPSLNLLRDTSLYGLKLRIKATELKEVDINYKKPVIEKTLDRTTVNVANSTFANATSATELLPKMPGVVVRDNNITLQGKDVDIWIDGRPTNVKGTQLQGVLNSLPANSIDKIELISNPSAAFDAQSSAIINIKTIKNKNFGLNGILLNNFAYGRFPRNTSGINLNYRNKDVNIYGSYYLQYVKQKSIAGSDFPANYSGIENQVQSDQQDITNNLVQPIKLGVDYSIGKNNTIGILFQGNVASLKTLTNVQTNIGENPNVPDSSVNLKTTAKNNYFNPSANLYFKHDLDAKGSSLVTNADYWNYNQEFNSNNENIYKFYSTLQTDKTSQFRNLLPAKNIIKSLTSDFTKLFNLYKFIAGLKLSSISKDNDFQWDDYSNGTWVRNNQRSDHFIYIEDIYAAYMGISQEFKKLSYQLVLRVENTDITSNSITLNRISNQNYTKLFPSFNIQYSVSEKQQFNLSYRKSINRPQYNYLDPFLIFINQFNYSVGNPNLKPQISNSLDASYNYNQELFLTASYTSVNNGFSRIYTKNPQTNYLTSSYDNLDHYINYNFNLNYNKKVSSKLMTFLNVNITYANINTHISDSLVNNRGIGLLVSDMNSYTLSKWLTATVFFAYSSPYKGTIYYYKSSGFLDLGLNMPAFNKHGNINLTVSDVLKTTRYAYKTNESSIDLTYKRNPDSRYVSLSVSYRFGSNTIKPYKNRNTGIEKEKGRMKSDQ